MHRRRLGGLNRQNPVTQRQSMCRTRSAAVARAWKPLPAMIAWRRSCGSDDEHGRIRLDRVVSFGPGWRERIRDGRHSETTSTPPEGEAIAATSTETREEAASQLVDRFAIWSGVAGTEHPVPFVDAFAVGGLQIQMRVEFRRSTTSRSPKHRQGPDREPGWVDDSGDQRYRRGERAQGGADLGTIAAGVRNAGTVCRRNLCHRQGFHPAL